jgi:hypothetical protein
METFKDFFVAFFLGTGVVMVVMALNLSVFKSILFGLGVVIIYHCLLYDISSIKR